MYFTFSHLADAIAFEARYELFIADPTVSAYSRYMFIAHERRVMVAAEYKFRPAKSYVLG